MNPKTIINIFGPSTAGKSTMTSLLQEHIKHLYTVDFDVVKRQLVGYEWKQDSGIATEITYATLAAAAQQKLTILALLPPPVEQAAYDRITSIAQGSQYLLLNIEITAPDEVLIKRYDARLREVEASGSNWRFKTREEFKTKLEKRYFRPDDTISYDSSKMTPQEIFNNIIQIFEKLE